MSTENLKELRNALSCWQDDYDCDDDKEQYDMFGAAIDAVSRLEVAERANSAQSDHINQQQDRIDSLEQKNAALGNALGTAERERDELRAEIARRDAAAGETAAYIIKGRYDKENGRDRGRLNWHGLSDRSAEDIAYYNLSATPLYTAAPPAVLPGEVEELSMLIRRLVHSLKNSNPHSGLLKSVPDYMRRKGFWKSTDCMRGDDVKQG